MRKNNKDIADESEYSFEFSALVFIETKVKSRLVIDSNMKICS